MAKKFKDYYDRECAVLLAGKFSSHRPDFVAIDFINWVASQLPDLEFFQRQDLFVDAVDKFLGNDYLANLQLFRQILGEELQTDTGMFTQGWWLWPVSRYVERYAAQQTKSNLQPSLDFIGELTKRFTGEFAIRPLLSAYPVQTLKQMAQWSLVKNVHQRRLASEGLRISLPWSKKLLVAIEYFDNYRAILANLRHAPEKFVQKSVGNNLNDLMKLYPEKAETIIEDWQAGVSSKAMEWIIKHGRRSLVKRKQA